jgi:serine/threonine-protein kinase HipA
MLVVGNTDAHLKNWSLIYRDGRTPSLAPVYDFHSLSIYDRYRHAPLALDLNGGRMAASIGPDDFRRMAERAGADPELTVGCATEAAHRLRKAGTGEVRARLSRASARSRHISRTVSTHCRSVTLGDERSDAAAGSLA